jgi:hypothetical protein
MHFPDLQRVLQQKAGQFISQNTSGILTAGGVIGVAATAALTARASFKAAGIIREKVAIRQAVAEEQEITNTPDLTKVEMVKAVWPVYILPVAMGVGTVASIVMANRMSAKRAAALAAAYTLSETRLQEYKDKVTNKFGANKERAVRDEIAQDRVNKTPPSKEVIILGSGDVLCFESLTGRYFNSSVEIIKQAENKLRTELFQTQYVSLSEFFEEIGLERTTFSDMTGWNTMHMEPFEISFSATMTPDNRPCLVLNYSVVPVPDYTRLY